MGLPKLDNWRLGKTLSGLVWWVSVVADIWMAGSWFGVNNKDPSYPVSVAQAGCCDGLVWGLFCWSIFNLLISWTHILMAAFSRIICYHEAQIMSNLFLNFMMFKHSGHSVLMSTQMACTFTRSQLSIVPFGCGGAWVTSWMCNNCVVLSRQHAPFPPSCWICATKN